MEPEDPLAKLKSLRQAPAAEPAEQSDSQPYQAFKAVNRRQLRLHIRAARSAGKFRAGERMTYSYLHRIVDDGDYGEQLALIFMFAVVVIRGRNLFQLAEAIEEERCAWMQPFDAGKWEKPADPKATLIENIDIHVEREQMVKAQDEVVQGLDRARR